MKWILEENNITQKDIDSVEQKLEIVFPGDFKEEVEQHNGGSPEFNIYDTETTKERIAEYLLSFNQKDQENILDTYISLKDRLPKAFIPIMTDPFGNYICYDFSNKNNPKVFFWNHEASIKEFIADDFTTFLNSLYAI